MINDILENYTRLYSKILMQHNERINENEVYAIFDDELFRDSLIDNEILHQNVKCSIIPNDEDIIKVYRYLKKQDNNLQVVLFLNSHYNNITNKIEEKDFFMTDFYDFSYYYLFSDFFQKFFNQYCYNEEKKKNLIDHWDENLKELQIHEKFLEKIKDIITPLGIIKYTLFNSELDHDFNEISDLNLFIDRDKKVFREFTIDSLLKKYNLYNYKIEVERNSNNFLDAYQILSGNDFFELIINWINLFRDSKNLLLIDDILFLFNSKFSLKTLSKSSMMYKKIRKWELRNYPYYIFSEYEFETCEILSYLLNCCKESDAVIRKEGDQQLTQLSQFLLGSSSLSQTRLNIVDFGAGYGDLIKIIEKMENKKDFVYYPVEISIDKCIKLEKLCKKSELNYIKPRKTLDMEFDAHIIFAINTFHELSLQERIDFLISSFNLISKNKGSIVIHEVLYLADGEKDFLVWDKSDIKLILNKISEEISVRSLVTKTRRKGWVLETIVIRNPNNVVVNQVELKNNILSSLEDIRKNWAKKLKNFDENNYIDNINKKIKAFLIAQNGNINCWIEEFLN